MSPLDQVLKELTQSLGDIEGRLLWDDLPVAALEEFKVTIDTVRTSLLAFLTASSPADYNSSLQTLRLRRAAQVCQNVFAGVIDGTISGAASGFTKLQSTVDETLAKVEDLIGNSA